MNEARKLRAVVVDDSEVVRLKLNTLLTTEGIEVVGEAPDGESGVLAAQQHQPDVVVMDLRMPGISGIEATWQLGSVSPGSQVLMLTVSEEQEDVTDAIMAGAKGYVVKGAPDEEIVSAIRRVADGERVISPHVASELIDRTRPRDPERAEAVPAPGSEAERVAAQAGLRKVGAQEPPPGLRGASAGEALGTIFSLRNLAQTLGIAIVVGALLTGVNYGEEITEGNLSSETAIKAALNVFVLFVVINIGLLAGRASTLD